MQYRMGVFWYAGRMRKQYRVSSIEYRGFGLPGLRWWRTFWLLCLFLLHTSYFILHAPVYALEGVGAQVKEVSQGNSITVTGRHAPRSQVVVAYGDEVVSAVLDEGQGDFTFTFEADNPKINSLQIFAIDRAGNTRRIEVPIQGLGNELLPPTIVQDPEVDLGDDGMGIGGYSYPGARVEVTLTGPNDLLTTDVVTTETDGGWQFSYDGLSPGHYVATAISSYGGTTSQVSQELEFDLLTPAGKVGDQVGNAVGNAVGGLVPRSVSNAAKKVSDQVDFLNRVLAPLVGTGILTQLLLLTQSLWYALVQLVTTLMQLLGFWKKRRPWGVVYDALTKKPLSYAIVRLLSVEKKMALVATDVTGKTGVFNFFPPAGLYVIKVSKPEYKFPSKLVMGKTDGEYAHVYHGEEVHFEGDRGVVDVSVPMDPLKVKPSLWFRLNRLVRQRIGMFTRVSMWLGLVMSLVAVIGGKGGMSGLLLLVYGLVLSLQWVVAWREKRSWGVVVSKVGKPVAGVQLHLIDSRFERLVQRRITGNDGRYQFVAPEGSYEIKVASVGHNLVKNYKGGYDGKEIVVTGARPKLIALKIVVEGKKN